MGIPEFSVEEAFMPLTVSQVVANLKNVSDLDLLVFFISRIENGCYTYSTFDDFAVVECQDSKRNVVVPSVVFQRWLHVNTAIESLQKLDQSLFVVFEVIVYRKEK